MTSEHFTLMPHQVAVHLGISLEQATTALEKLRSMGRAERFTLCYHHCCEASIYSFKFGLGLNLPIVCSNCDEDLTQLADFDYFDSMYLFLGDKNSVLNEINWFTDNNI